MGPGSVGHPCVLPVRRAAPKSASVCRSTELPPAASADQLTHVFWGSRADCCSLPAQGSGSRVAPPAAMMSWSAKRLPGEDPRYLLIEPTLLLMFMAACCVHTISKLSSRMAGMASLARQNRSLHADCLRELPRRYKSSRQVEGDDRDFVVLNNGGQDRRCPPRYPARDRQREGEPTSQDAPCCGAHPYGTDQIGQDPARTGGPRFRPCACAPAPEFAH